MPMQESDGVTTKLLSEYWEMPQIRANPKAQCPQKGHTLNSLQRLSKDFKVCLTILCITGVIVLLHDSVLNKRYIARLLFTANLIFYRLVSTKRSSILKQTCSCQVEVCLNMYNI